MINLKQRSLVLLSIITSFAIVADQTVEQESRQLLNDILVVKKIMIQAAFAGLKNPTSLKNDAAITDIIEKFITEQKRQYDITGKTYDSFEEFQYVNDGNKYDFMIARQVEDECIQIGGMIKNDAKEGTGRLVDVDMEYALYTQYGDGIVAKLDFCVEEVEKFNKLHIPFDDISLQVQQLGKMLKVEEIQSPRAQAFYKDVLDNFSSSEEGPMIKFIQLDTYTVGAFVQMRFSERSIDKCPISFIAMTSKADIKGDEKAVLLYHIMKDIYNGFI